LPNPRITVGLPVYQAAAHMPKTLDCLQRQTYGEFEAIISVDGNDHETADACRPFLADSRFRMIVHPTRLDWFGNFNWLLQQENGQALYEMYYFLSRPLVAEIQTRADREAIWQDIYENGFSKCLELIQQNRYEEAKAMYVNLMHGLANRFLGQEVVAEALI
jgi:glycosyltransferase involved in cell wall biosynthesis